MEGSEFRDLGITKIHTSPEQSTVQNGDHSQREKQERNRDKLLCGASNPAVTNTSSGGEGGGDDVELGSRILVLGDVVAR
jgi:hypothetical protein